MIIQRTWSSGFLSQRSFPKRTGNSRRKLSSGQTGWVTPEAWKGLLQSLLLKLECAQDAPGTLVTMQTLHQ